MLRLLRAESGQTPGVCSAWAGAPPPSIARQNFRRGRQDLRLEASPAVGDRDEIRRQAEGIRAQTGPGRPQPPDELVGVSCGDRPRSCSYAQASSASKL